MNATVRLVRAPSVDDYARMTAKARLSAVRLLEEQMRQIERRRLALAHREATRWVDAKRKRTEVAA